MYWNSESTRHVAPSGNPDRVGIQRADVQAFALREAASPEGVGEWREVERGLWRLEDDQFMASVTAPWPGEEAWSWTVETLARQQIRGGQAYGKLRAMNAAEDVMGAHRTAADASPTSQKPGIGEHSDSPTLPEEHPEEDGTLKAMLARAIRTAATPYGGHVESRRTASRKTGSLWDMIEEPRHKVAGWNWDSHLEGYVAEGAADFACICGSNVTAPGQVVCACGKFWNSYQIASGDGVRLVCREVPVRDGVLLAGRGRTAGGQKYVRDSDYWGLPEGTPIKPGMKPEGESGGSGSGSEGREPDPKDEAPASAGVVPELTPEELQQRIAEVQTKVEEAKDAGLETNVAYAVDGKVDSYNDERRAQQDRLVAKMWEKYGAHIPREGKALMSGGLGGAGKGTVLKSDSLDFDKSQYLEVNADEVKEMMVKEGMVPEIEGVAPMELAALIHEESSYISTLLAEVAYESKTNMIWDITMGSTGSVQKRIDALRKAGYEDISAVFVDIPVEKSVERALSRYERGLESYRNGEGSGGRYVPPEVIRKNNPSEGSRFRSKNRENFEALKSQFDNAAVFDNSVDGQPAQKVNGFGRWARLLRARYARRRR